MKLVNLTQKQISLTSPDGKETILKPGPGAAFAPVQGKLRTVEGLPVPVREPDGWGQAFNLLGPAPDCMYLVSDKTGAAAREKTDRTDLLMLPTVAADKVTEPGGLVRTYKALRRVSPASGPVPVPPPRLVSKVDKLVNLTTADLTLRSADGTNLFLPMSKTAWVVSLVGKPETVGDLPVPIRTPDGWGKFTNLPEPVEGTVLILVPSTARAVREKTDRNDVVTTSIAFAGDSVKDTAGKIVAWTALRLA